MTEEEKKAAAEAAEKKLSEANAKLEEMNQSLETAKANLEKIQADTTQTEEAKKKAEEAVAALEKEKARVLGDIEAMKAERRSYEGFESKVRSENLEIAKERFFKQFGDEYASEESKQRLLREFEKFDSKSVNAELILKDLLRAHVAMNPEKYVSLESTVKKLSEGSDEFKAMLSGSGFPGGGTRSPSTYEGLDKEDIMAAEWAGIPLAQYAKLKQEGRI